MMKPPTPRYKRLREYIEDRYVVRFDYHDEYLRMNEDLVAQEHYSLEETRFVAQTIHRKTAVCSGEGDITQVKYCHPEDGYKFSYSKKFVVDSRDSEKIQLKEASYGRTRGHFVTTINELKEDSGYAYIQTQKSLTEKIKSIFTR